MAIGRTIRRLTSIRPNISGVSRFSAFASSAAPQQEKGAPGQYLSFALRELVDKFASSLLDVAETQASHERGDESVAPDLNGKKIGGGGQCDSADPFERLGRQAPLLRP